MIAALSIRTMQCFVEYFNNVSLEGDGDDDDGDNKNLPGLVEKLERKKNVGYREKEEM